MKVIAKVDDKKFLLEATSDEIAKVLGYSCEYYIPETSRGCYEKIKVGYEIGVNEMYQACQSVKDSSAKIEEAIKTHKQLIDNLATFSVAIKPAADIIRAKELKNG